MQDGHVRVDGQDISTCTQQSLRRQIAYVPQEALLFHRSIRENIAYGRPGASEEESAVPPSLPTRSSSSIACPAALIRSWVSAA